MTAYRDEQQRLRDTHRAQLVGQIAERTRAEAERQNPQTSDAVVNMEALIARLDVQIDATRSDLADCLRFLGEQPLPSDGIDTPAPAPVDEAPAPYESPMSPMSKTGKKGK